MHVLELDDFAAADDAAPAPSPDVTDPVLLADDHQVLFAYRIAEGQDSDRWSVADAGSTAVCRFVSPLGVYFGAPNDEALGNHPLFGRGLGFYGVYHVMPSSWTAQLTRLAAKKGRVVNAGPLHHYVITMHDSILEVVCRGVAVELVSASPARGVAESFAR